MGIHVDFSTFNPRTVDLVEARRTMWAWAEPVIIDRAEDRYALLVDDAGTATMARRHGRLWRNILFDQSGSVASIRREMARMASALGLPAGTIDEVDDMILEDLVDIVMGRYRTSRQGIKTFSLVLMSATSCLGALRAA